jgi:hypothetical protein
MKCDVVGSGRLFSTDFELMLVLRGSVGSVEGLLLVGAISIVFLKVLMV